MFNPFDDATYSVGRNNEKEMLLVKRKWSPLVSFSLKLFQVCVVRQDDSQVPEGIDSPKNKNETPYIFKSDKRISNYISSRLALRRQKAS